MEECNDCDYSEIVDWVEDTKSGKATPIYWCERKRICCEKITECEYKEKTDD